MKDIPSNSFMSDIEVTFSEDESEAFIILRAPKGGEEYKESQIAALLKDAGVVGTPGSGFGPSGEGYFRLTAFGSYENTVAAIERIKKMG